MFHDGPILESFDVGYNRLIGKLPNYAVQGAFPELRIFEISDQNFTGSLPPNYFMNWKASSLQMNEDGNLQYKGLYVEQVKALTFYRAIDLSENRFLGQIPESIGEIPQGTQITGQPKSSFEGNERLCGLPLEDICTGGPHMASIQHVKKTKKERC
ncbi:hypothetical protein IGI04_016498 [Brassica rapa subsp. trilocularis]|uniref:Uncharacterized protein n=1 Tax=Brassica rapa subsp. trilocularis TaxID=1813537 RepID=A0ABQ7MVK8_BRACM|nr:hypothetical protein IGI04_016498 [Brassica rapa subsp. trilocularis]